MKNRFSTLPKRYPWRWTWLAVFVSVFISVFIPIPKDKLSPLPVISLRITDRNGVTLREVLSDQEGRAYWLRWNEIPPDLVKATIAVKDSRFYFHPGIDPISTLRAMYQDIRARRIVSGGSTITQQVIRNIYHLPRSIPGKILEAWYALRLERTISKREILLQYLNRVPYGNGTYGVEAASRLYFDKPASQLSLAEAALITGLPNAPSSSNPYTSLPRALARQRFILKMLLEKEMISRTEYRRAVDEPIQIVKPERHFRAPHFTNMVLQKVQAADRGQISVIKTTLDYEIQKVVELLVKGQVAALKKHRVTNAAAVVIDNASGDIIAFVGSVDYFDSLTDGQVNGALSLRQPGSALKPFTYGLALESGMTSATILPDLPYSIAGTSTTAEGYAPENYDRKFHGPVRLRTALSCSYNVPAVRIAETVGVRTLLHRLHEAGFVSLNQDASFYGPALTLGDGEVTLLELTNAYAALARGGTYKNYHMILSERDIAGNILNCDKPDSSRQVFSPQVSYILTNILSDNDARTPAFGLDSPIDLPFPCAVKTGTSKDYRDNWTIGYTPRWTVGVWVGNFDNKPMRRISGISGAGPLFHDIMLYLEQRGTGGDFPVPPGLVKRSVCVTSGQLPGKYCPGTIEEIFIAGTEPRDTCTVHRLYRIDTRTSTLANRDTPKEFVEKKLFEVLPPVFDQWATQEGIPKPPSREGLATLNLDSTRYPGFAKTSFAITGPEDGAVFKIDPVLRREFQDATITAAVDVSYQNVRLYVDDKPFSNLSQSNFFEWNLQPGNHTFQLIGECGGRLVKSGIVHVTVYQ